jgi:uncharacterized protein (DUF2225 family)
MINVTTMTDIELNCPYCDRIFQSSTIISTNTFGPRTTDLYQKAGGYQPLSLFIHTCPSCGYTGFSGDFENVELDENLKDIIGQRLTPLVRDEKAFPGRRYEYAAWIAKWRNRPSINIGQLYHMAAWCCYDDGRIDEEKYYRRQTIEYYEKALKDMNIPEDQSAQYTYLVGELYRRIGESDKAALWFDRVPEAAKKFKNKEWIIKLSNQQKENPKEFID